MEVATESAPRPHPQSEGRSLSMLIRPQESQTARASNRDNSVPHQGNVPASVPPQPQPQVSTAQIIHLTEESHISGLLH